MGQSQAASLAADAARFGALGPAAGATPTGAMFFSVQPPLKRPDGRPWPDSRYISAHSVGGTDLWVTLFRREALRGRQGVHVLPTGDYWNALRRHADIIVVARQPPSAGPPHCAVHGRVVLVVAADEGDVRAPGAVRDALVEAGVRPAGCASNRAQPEAPSFLGGLRHDRRRTHPARPGPARVTWWARRASPRRC